MPSLRELNGKLLRVKVEHTEVKWPDDGSAWAGLWVWLGEDGKPTYGSKTSQERTCFEPVETVAEAHGVRFLCPKSYAKNGGPKGTHSVYIFFQGSPHAGHNLAGQEVRWTVAGGTTLDDLSLTPSIQEQDEGKDPCNWHGFVGSNGVPPGHAA